ncbi:hypothetical protein ACE4RU_07745 [Actinobacillus seminis]|uniref:hypothetical protein n=1 Tax=Actinobacillus seminis TaxID=722 RepID=UPI003B94943A
MEYRDQSQKTNKKIRKQNVHVKLTEEELQALDDEMRRVGIDSRSAIGRILIRRALGINS